MIPFKPQKLNCTYFVQIYNIFFTVSSPEGTKGLIRRSGFEPGVDIEIKFVGLGPGKKLHDELITEREGMVRALKADEVIG